jgi:GNAT superfamily N-acetyltransferase
VTSSNEGRTPSGLFSFRRATPADAALLPIVTRRCYGHWYDHLWAPGERDAYLARIYAPDVVARELADPSVVYELAWHAGPRDAAGGPEDAVGFTKLVCRQDLAERPDGAYLERIYVHPSAGRGLGTLLTERALERARAAGRAYVWLRAMDTAVKPMERYAALGFRDVGGERLAMPGMLEAYRGMRVMVREL